MNSEFMWELQVISPISVGDPAREISDKNRSSPKNMFIVLTFVTRVSCRTQTLNLIHGREDGKR